MKQNLTGNTLFINLTFLFSSKFIIFALVFKGGDSRRHSPGHPNRLAECAFSFAKLHLIVVTLGGAITAIQYKLNPIRQLTQIHNNQ